eukprot:6195170-Pleurochrysis_carterae.AAC.10
MFFNAAASSAAASCCARRGRAALQKCTDPLYARKACAGPSDTARSMPVCITASAARSERRNSSAVCWADSASCDAIEGEHSVLHFHVDVH